MEYVIPAAKMEYKSMASTWYFVFCVNKLGHFVHAIQKIIFWRRLKTILLINWKPASIQLTCSPRLTNCQPSSSSMFLASSAKGTSKNIVCWFIAGTGIQSYLQATHLIIKNFILQMSTLCTNVKIVIIMTDPLGFDSPSIRATSGFSDAVFNSGPITTGRYCWKSLPRSLHILAQADIMYEICGSSSSISVESVCVFRRSCMISVPSCMNWKTRVTWEYSSWLMIYIITLMFSQIMVGAWYNSSGAYLKGFILWPSTKSWRSGTNEM